MDFGEGVGSDTDTARKFMTAFRNDRITVELCFCSVFDECWNTSKGNSAAPPKPVELCPMPKRQYSY
jgi:hypothetical protein